MRPYKAYVFDFDYTLADSSRGIVTCFRRVLERHGYTKVTDTDIKRTIGRTLEEAFSILTGVDDAAVLAAYKKEYGAEADVYMTANTELFPETAEVLEALKSRGAAVGIVSTKYRFRILDLLEQKGRPEWVDFIVGGEDVRTPKPSPEGLLLAVERAGCRKEEVLYVGDSIVDARTAQTAGVDFVGVLNGMTTREELAAYPHCAIADDLRGLLSDPL